MLNDYLGKILLAVSLVFFGVVTYFNRAPDASQEFAKADKVKDIGKTQVKLVIQTGAKELDKLFPSGGPEMYAGSDRLVFPIKVAKVAIYEPVELGVPDPLMPRAPQVLSTPGPSLQGSDKLPRWTDELSTLPTPPEPRRNPGASAVAPGNAAVPIGAGVPVGAGAPPATPKPNRP